MPETHLRRANLRPVEGWFAARTHFTKPPTKPTVTIAPAPKKGRAAKSSGGDYSKYAKGPDRPLLTMFALQRKDLENG
jgi:hypothetical protein